MEKRSKRVKVAEDQEVEVKAKPVTRSDAIKRKQQKGKQTGKHNQKL